ncbi:MAG: hypothetical protein ACRETI_02850, partial [Steroidobacteraceae bacterium]
QVGLRWLFQLRGPVQPPEEVVLVLMNQEAASRIALPRAAESFHRCNSRPCVEDSLTAEGHLHGMASYGIIAGKPDNQIGLTGIAPNSTHIAVEQVSIINYSEQYARWKMALAT